MLQKLLLLSALLLATASWQPALGNLQCRELAPESVCTVAHAGFKYLDGCNYVSCSGFGRYSTTLKWCRRPSSAEERRECRRQAADVFRSLGPFICSNLEPTGVCRSRSDGFRFSDGCNSITCESGGSFTSTLKMCPSGDPQGAYCQFAETQLNEIEGDRKRRRGTIWVRGG